MQGMVLTSLFLDAKFQKMRSLISRSYVQKGYKAEYYKVYSGSAKGCREAKKEEIVYDGMGGEGKDWGRHLRRGGI